MDDTPSTAPVDAGKPTADVPTLTVVAIDPAQVIADHRLLVSVAMGLTVLLDLHQGEGQGERIRLEAMENLARQVEPWLPDRGGRES
jgi:hypothetical protein